MRWGIRKGWFSNTSFKTGLKTLPTFRPDALVFFRAKRWGDGVEKTLARPPLLHCADVPSSNDPGGDRSNMESVLAQTVHSISEFVILRNCMTIERKVLSVGDIQLAVVGRRFVFFALFIRTQCTECAM